MPIDPSISLGIRPLQVDSPLQTLSHLMQIRHYGQQAETQRLEQQRLRQDISTHDQAIQDDAAIRNELMKTKNAKGEPDIDAAIKNLYTNGHPQAAVKLDEHIQTARKRAADADKVAIENKAGSAKAVSQHLQNVHDEPSFQAARTAIHNLIGPEAAAPLGDTYNPTVIEQAIAAGTEAGVHWKRVKDAQDAIEEALKAGRAEQNNAPERLAKWTAAVGKTMETSRSQEDWDQHLQSLKLYGAPDAVLETYPAQFSPAGVKQAHANAMTAGQEETSQHEDQRISLERERLRFEREKFNATPESKDPAWRRDFSEYESDLRQAQHKHTEEMGVYKAKLGALNTEEQRAAIEANKPAVYTAQTFEQWRAEHPHTAPVTPGAPATTPPVARPAVTPDTIKATPATSQSKVVTVAELTQLAQSKGTTVDQERARAIAAGYAVVR